MPLKMEQIECSETSAYINQAPGNHPKENKQHSEHGESLKSRIVICYYETHCKIKHVLDVWNEVTNIAFEISVYFFALSYDRALW